jgi:tetratricopeptide (TPR) repeat protein
MSGRALLPAAIAAALLLAGCDDRDPPPEDGVRPATNHRSESSAWVGPFGEGPHQPTAQTLKESRQLDEIQRAMDDGLYDRARGLLKTLLEGGSQHPGAYYLQAKLCYQQANYEAALPWCDRAIAASPYWVEPRVMLAQSYIHLKRLGAAENVFGDLDRLAPRLPWGPYGIGVVALMRGDQARATTLLDEALRRDPDHAPSLRVRAELIQGRDPELEERLLSRYLAHEPDSAWAFTRLGELALAANHLDDAHRAFVHAYDLEPDPTVARRLAEIAQRRDDPADARRWQDKAGTRKQPGAQPAGDQQPGGDQPANP